MMFNKIMDSPIWGKLFRGYGFLFLAFLYLPLGLILAYSFNANTINMAVWTEFTTEWYFSIFGMSESETSVDAAFIESPERIFEVVKHSAIVAFCAATVSTVIGTATRASN